jgi:recombination protein RecA
LPVGRIVELYGQPSSGKTTTALQAAAALQQKVIAEGRDEYILYLDFEHAIDGDYAAGLGLDVYHPTFVIAQPHWLEDGAEIAERLIKTGKFRLSIWDSVAEMTPRDLEFGVRTNAMERARLMNSLLQRFNSLLHEQNCCAVYLNHLVEAVQMGGARPGLPPPETTPGGKALKFYASIRIAYKQIKQIKGLARDALSGDMTEVVTAQQVKVKVTKNKVGPPFREAEVRVTFGRGFDNIWSALQVLSAHKQIRRGSAGWHRFDERLGHPSMPVVSGLPSIQGEANVLTFAEEHPDWGQLIVAEAVQAIEKYGAGDAGTFDGENVVADDVFASPSGVGLS